MEVSETTRLIHVDSEQVIEFSHQTIEKAKDVYYDFMKFVNQGNVFDLAIGIILGTSFSVYLL
jgi:hypothetical protein